MKCLNCNETDHEPTAKYCHVCGGVLDPERAKLLDYGKKVQESWEEMRRRQDAMDDHPVSWWSKVLRYLLLLFILIEYVFVSVMEYHLHEPWGLITIGMVNGLSFLMTLALCVFANKGDYGDKKGGWRLYYNWLHFLDAAIVPIIGLLICSNIQNLLTIILEMALTGLLLMVDFGTMEDLFDVS